MPLKNFYQHSIDLTQLSIRNAPRTQFAQSIIDLPYRGYEVETCTDGRKIVITKPGGKTIYGHPKKEDIMVFIFNPRDNTLWQITHKQILEDVTKKCQTDSSQGLQLLLLLERTFNGEEPNDFIHEIQKLNFEYGEKTEELIKAYKWIWGQEDVNYPNGEGRSMSWEEYKLLIESLNNDTK